MAALNFPTSPTTGDLHVENGRVYEWTGVFWRTAGIADTLTRFVSLGNLLLPSGTEPPYWQPSSSLDTNDLIPTPVLVYDDSSVKKIASCSFPLPNDYAGNPVFTVRWKGIPTSGVVVIDVDYYCCAYDESADPSAFTRSLTTTSTALGTARRRNDVSLSATAGDFSLGDQIFVSLGRDGTDGADTMSGAMEVVEFLFEYTRSL